MRSASVDSTTVYRWLYTNTAPSGAVSQSAKGPYARKQNVNHRVPSGYHVKVELQQLDARGYGELKWITIKTVDLKNEGDSR